MEAKPTFCHPVEPVTFSIFSRFCTRPDIFQSPRKRRHPERSASQIYRITGFYGAESKDPGDACWQTLFGAFRPQTTREIKKSQPPSAAEGSAVSLDRQRKCAAPAILTSQGLCNRTFRQGRHHGVSFRRGMNAI